LYSDGQIFDKDGQMKKPRQEVIDCAKRWAFHYGKSGGKHYDSAADKVRVQNETIHDLLNAVKSLNASARRAGGIDAPEKP